MIAFSAEAQTAEETRCIAHVAIETVRAQVLHTIAGVLKRSSKVEALGIFVAAIEVGEVEDVSGLLGNPSEQSIEMQAIVLESFWRVPCRRLLWRDSQIGEK